ncbi:MAG: serine/threonine protein kinase [Planctomycetales bacterium]|nr:serine/threonine protein kinase [Planctomycetales bacterium]
MAPSLVSNVRPATVPTSRNAAPAAPTVERLGEWQLLDCLASNELATTYEARHVDAPSDAPASYVVKVAVCGAGSDPRPAAVIAREAEVGTTVSHPHLVPVLAAQTHRPPYYVVQPRLQGSTAEALFGATARPPLGVAVWIVRQAAEALEALYRHGWMHADVKPANIFVSREGHATLLDLGFARRLRGGETLVDRRVCGTPGYIAPELFTSRGQADIRSDIYALGVTLYEMITGRRPLVGRGLPQLAVAHLTARPDDLCAVCPHAPESLGRLVAEMLAKEPLRRPHTPGELIERLTRIEITTLADRAAA